jgi:hypothetical protein
VRHIPEWFPAAIFKRTANQWRKELLYLLNMPIERVKSELRTNTAKPSYVSMLLNREDISKELEDEIAWSALSLYTGGADTVSIREVRNVSSNYRFALIHRTI